ncbi:uncharacterized protein LOC113795773 [Dermatophagoides pteronyssinus]|uniref:uncharacterized protein LOC113795773 n=1 Tax=Dermatophagoides pteronyssinus TaxID=6956 RepID=UPI003F663372
MRKKNKNRHSFHHHHHSNSIMSMAINLVNNNNNNHYYIINSVILIFVFISILWSSFQIVQINAFEDLNNDELSTFCIIGQLFKCNDDEDCIELDDDQNQNHSKDHHHHHIDIPIGQRLGNCVCRDSNHCKRSIKTDNNMQLPQSDHLSNLVNYQTNSNLKLIISISMIMAIIGFLSFIIYYYGIRYGMIQYYARRLGLINNRQNSNIEDNQLLNHISSTTTTTTANHDDIELTL